MAPFQTFAVKDGSFYSCGRGGGAVFGALGGRGPSSAHEGTLTEVTDPDPGDVESVYGNPAVLRPVIRPLRDASIRGGKLYSVQPPKAL